MSSATPATKFSIVYDDDDEFNKNYNYVRDCEDFDCDNCDYDEEDAWNEEDAQEEELIYLAELRQFEDTYYHHVYQLQKTGKFTYIAHTPKYDRSMVWTIKVFELSYFATKLDMTVDEFRAVMYKSDTIYSVAKLIESIFRMYEDNR